MSLFDGILFGAGCGMAFLVIAGVIMFVNWLSQPPKKRKRV